MKKALILTLILFLSILQAQQQELINNVWQFEKLTFNSQDYYWPEEIVPEIGTFYYVGYDNVSGDVFTGSSGCNTFQFWNSYFDESHLNFGNFVTTLAECGPIELDNFDMHVLGFFELTFNEEENVYNTSYEIEYFEGYKLLIITNLLGDKIYYKAENMLTDENTGNFEFHIFPNPTKDYIQINSPENIQKVTVLGIDGKLLKSYFGQNQLNLNDLSKGIYLVQIETETQKVVKKVMKK